MKFSSFHTPTLAIALSLCGALHTFAADKLPLQQAQIKGLLVVELSNGEHAGTASQMNATVVNGSDDDFEIKFNQDVGPMMESATAEVEKFIRVRYPDKIPKGKTIELAFADKYSPKDGPSAAVVSALLSDAIFSGNKIDPDFAATGDMTATGEVRPVGGVSSKISGAIKKHCKIIGVPIANAESITDNYLLDGIKPLYDIQIFTLKSFDQALDLASTERSEKLAEAVKEFALVQQALQKSEKYVFNPQVLEKLRKIVIAAPNHHSARLLYMHGSRKAPKTLSLAGSISGIDNASSALMQMIDDGRYLDNSGNNDTLFIFNARLNELGPALDKKTRAYSRSLLSLSQMLDQIRDKKYFSEQIRRELNQTANRVDTERNNLLNDKTVREELMLD